MTAAERSLLIVVAEELLQSRHGSSFAEQARKWLRAVKKEAGLVETDPGPPSRSMPY